jgi:ribosomal-protein-serine acetyltransferase
LLAFGHYPLIPNPYPLMFEDLLGDFTNEPLPQRYELRLLQIDDAAQMFTLTDTNRDYLREWLPWLDTIEGVNDTQNFIEHTRQQAIEREGFVAAIWELGEAAQIEKDRIVGVIGLNKIEWQNRIGYIGYWLAESDCGRGIMTSACRVLIEYSFLKLNLNRLVIACACANQRSRSIPIRLGFSHEGVARDAEWLYDRFVDHEIYALLLREWRGGWQTGKIKTLN